jgi:hypothetical protein
MFRGSRGLPRDTSEEAPASAYGPGIWPVEAGSKRQDPAPVVGGGDAADSASGGPEGDVSPGKSSPDVASLDTRPDGDQPCGKELRRGRARHGLGGRRASPAGGPGHGQAGYGPRLTGRAIRATRPRRGHRLVRVHRRGRARFELRPEATAVLRRRYAPRNRAQLGRADPRVSRASRSRRRLPRVLVPLAPRETAGRR